MEQPDEVLSPAHLLRRFRQCLLGLEYQSRDGVVETLRPGAGLPCCTTPPLQSWTSLLEGVQGGPPVRLSHLAGGDHHRRKGPEQFETSMRPGRPMGKSSAPERGGQCASSLTGWELQSSVWRLAPSPMAGPWTLETENRWPHQRTDAPPPPRCWPWWTISAPYPGPVPTIRGNIQTHTVTLEEVNARTCRS